MSFDLTHIDRYLDGEMDKAEALQFEAELISNKELAEEVKLQREMRALYSEDEWLESSSTVLRGNSKGEQYARFFKSKEAAELQNSIKSVIKKERQPKRNNGFRLVGIAATLLFLTVSVFFFLNRGVDYNELYTQYMDKDNLTSIVSRGTDNTILVNGQLSFEAGDYTESIALFEEYQANSKRIHPTTYIYLGISYLELGDYESALGTFEKLEKSNTLESSKSNWFRAMVYLKQGNKKELTAILEQIVSNADNYNFAKANALLEAVR